MIGENYSLAASYLAEADVIVAGGGSAGFSAALAAARQGAKTILVEKNAILGGVATMGMMMSIGNHICTGDDRLAIRGIPEELVDRLARESGTNPNWKSSKHQHITFDIEVMIDVMYRMLSEVGVKILINTTVTDTLMDGNRIKGVLISHDKAGRFRLSGKTFIDATGDALLAAQAGEVCTLNKDQATMLYLLSDVDLDELYEFLRTHQEQYPTHLDHDSTFAEFEKNWLENGIFHTPHGGGLIYSFIQDAVKEDGYKKQVGNIGALDVLGLFGLKDRKTCLINSNVFFVDCGDPWQASSVEIEARGIIKPCVDFFRKAMPGFQNAKLVSSAREIGLRGWRRIHGQYPFTNSEKGKPSRFPDVVWCGPCIGWAESKIPAEKFFGGGLKYLGGQVKLNTMHDVPFRALRPNNVPNLVMASGKSYAGGCLRSIAHCLAAGQAAGVAAALAAPLGDFDKMDIRSLQSALLRQGVYLGDTQRLKELGL